MCLKMFGVKTHFLKAEMIIFINRCLEQFAKCRFYRRAAAENIKHINVLLALKTSVVMIH